MSFLLCAVRRFTCARNVLPAGQRGAPYERKVGEPFPGATTPFVTRSRFKQQPNVERGPDTRKLGASMVWGGVLWLECQPRGRMGPQIRARGSSTWTGVAGAECAFSRSTR